MNFSQFKFSYYSVLFLLKTFVFLILGIWIYNSFNYFEQVHFFSYISDLSKVEKNLNTIWELMKTWLISSGWVILKVVLIQCTSYTFKRFWVMSKWLTYWDNLGEINPIFGRNISEHFRWNNTLNFMQIIQIHNLSSVQYSFLKMHKKNQHIVNIAQKYDPFYARDIHFLKIQEELKNNKVELSTKEEQPKPQPENKIQPQKEPDLKKVESKTEEK
jgi:hypothetical protein